MRKVLQMWKVLLSLWFGFVLVLPGTLAAQTGSEASAASPALSERAADVVAVFNGTASPDAVFADSFLLAVPPAQLNGLIDQLSRQYGPMLSVENIEPKDAQLAEVTFRFERALGKATLVIESAAPHRITGLRITSFQTIDDTLAKVEAELRALPGDVGVLFAPVDPRADPVLVINADRQFAIGSTFKLYVLSALARSIEAGERRWDDVIALDRKSFPSGRLQNWPEGAPVTLHTLATLMISISDNTATDLLFHTLGRDRIEAEMLRIGHSRAKRNLPMLSTLELFALKGSPANLRKYVAADERGKRGILLDFEDDVGGDPDLVTPPRFVQPTAIDTVEWFASAQDLRNIARRLSQITDPRIRKIMAVNTSLPADVTAAWNYVGYKGGSEPGVLNLTWLLQDNDGAWHVLTMSWNNPDAPLDNSALETLATRLIALR